MLVCFGITARNGLSVAPLRSLADLQHVQLTFFHSPIYDSPFTIYHRVVNSRALIIINPAAARARRAWTIIRERLDSQGVSYDVHETQRPGDATTAVTKALKSGWGLIAVVGGDGTLSEAANGFFEISQTGDSFPQPINAAAALAILPAGTGDDFARNLHGNRLPLPQWVETFIAHWQQSRERTTRLVDVIRVRTDEYRRRMLCLNASTLGLGGETAARVAAQGKLLRHFSGEARFVIAAMGALAAWRERPVKVRIDGATMIEGPMNLAAVANARYAGGGMMLSPQAMIDDGRLDVVAVSGLNRAEILRELTRIHKGGHVANPKVTIKQGQYVSIETSSFKDALPIEVDGNVSGHTPADYALMPKALRFVL